jgi:small subunit ribosomal protein S21
VEASWDLVNQPNLFCCHYQNIWFIAKYNTKWRFVLPKVELRDGESQEKLLRRFRKVVTRSGVLSEVRKRRWFVSKNEQRRMEDKKAIRRRKKRARKQREYNN